MQPDIRLRTDMSPGRSYGPASSITSATFAPAVASATLTPGIDLSESAPVMVAGPAAVAGSATDVTHAHANGNGIHAMNGHVTTRLATWSNAMAATAGAGATIATSTVRATSSRAGSISGSASG